MIRCLAENCEEFFFSPDHRQYCQKHCEDKKTLRPVPTEKSQVKIQDTYTSLQVLHEFLGNTHTKLQESIFEMMDNLNKALSHNQIKEINQVLKNTKSFIAYTTKTLKKLTPPEPLRLNPITPAIVYSQQLYYTLSKTQKRGYSYIYSRDILSKKEMKLKKGNYFSNTVLSCKISEEKVFLYIGAKGINSVIFDPTIVDNVGSLVESVGSSVSNHYQGSFTLFRDKIYFFGGESRASEYFDIIRKKWSDIRELPLDMKGLTSCSVGEFIYITADSSAAILRFTPNTEVFEVIQCQGLLIGISKICIGFQGAMIVIQNDEVLRLTNDPYMLEKLGSIKPKNQESRPITSPLYLGNIVYFLTQNKKILKFDLSLFNLS